MDKLQGQSLLFQFVSLFARSYPSYRGQILKGPGQLGGTLLKRGLDTGCAQVWLIVPRCVTASPDTRLLQKQIASVQVYRSFVRLFQFRLLAHIAFQQEQSLLVFCVCLSLPFSQWSNAQFGCTLPYPLPYLVVLLYFSTYSGMLVYLMPLRRSYMNKTWIK